MDNKIIFWGSRCLGTHCSGVSVSAGGGAGFDKIMDDRMIFWGKAGASVRERLFIYFINFSSEATFT